jgi:hypothetical protein
MESRVGAKFDMSHLGSTTNDGSRGVAVSRIDDVSWRLGIKGLLFSGGMSEFFMAVIH